MTDHSKLLFDAACECSSPDQMNAIEALIVGDADYARRLINCINKRQAAQPIADANVPTDDDLVKKWFAENNKYIVAADFDAWLEQAYRDGLKAARAAAPVSGQDAILDSRFLHTEAVADDEPKVDSAKLSFWRQGWNAYRNAMLDSRPRSEDSRIKAPDGYKWALELDNEWHGESSNAGTAQEVERALATTAAPERSGQVERAATQPAVDLRAARAAMARAKQLPVWDNINHALHVELDIIFKALAAPISEASAPRDERIDVLRRTLEIIAVGDAPYPRHAAADALVITGFWLEQKAEQADSSSAAPIEFCECDGDFHKSGCPELVARLAAPSPTGESLSAANASPAYKWASERERFEKAIGPRFDYTMVRDSWDRPIYKAPHVESIFYGWRLRDQAALATPRQTEGGGVPEGWKLVPIVPTPKMVDSTFNDDLSGLSHNARNKFIWRDMLAASPAPTGARK